MLICMKDLLLSYVIFVDRMKCSASFDRGQMKLLDERQVINDAAADLVQKGLMLLNRTANGTARQDFPSRWETGRVVKFLSLSTRRD